MMIVTWDRKLDAFRRVLHGETYKKVAIDYEVSDAAIRADVFKIFHRAGQSIKDLDYETARELGQYDIKMARINKQFWLECLDKYLAGIQDQERKKREIRDYINQRLNDGWGVHCLESFINTVFEELKEQRTAR